MTAFFITATGTDIGKTFVTKGLIRHMHATGRPVAFALVLALPHAILDRHPAAAAAAP